MAQVELRYNVSVGIQTASNLISRVQDIQLDRGETALLGMDVISDQTVLVAAGPDCDPPPSIQRTIVLETNAQGDSLFPTAAAIIAATQNLWRAVLNLKVPGTVTAEVPVVT